MSKLSNKTKSIKESEVERSWYIVDATDQPIGRLASQIAATIRGKHKPYFTPHVDCGDYVIVVNAEKVKFTGEKYRQKEYVHYSGYPGGKKVYTPEIYLDKNPTKPVELAVWGMLPKNKLGKKLFHHLFVYEGENHPHHAQKPEPLKLNQ